MFLRRFVAFLLLFVLSQIPLAVALAIREYQTVSAVVSADSAEESAPVPPNAYEPPAR